MNQPKFKKNTKNKTLRKNNPELIQYIVFKCAVYKKLWDVQANSEGVTHSSHGTMKAVGQVFLEAVI